jgi:hypothetical protein
MTAEWRTRRESSVDRKAFADWIEPQHTRLAAYALDDADWLDEIKCDGSRRHSNCRVCIGQSQACRRKSPI